MSRRRRRTLGEVFELALKLASKGPFTAQKYADLAGFTPNRARQILEDLKTNGKLVELGKRPSSRGKPAVLWGFEGTKIMNVDLRVPRVKSPHVPSGKVAQKVDMVLPPAASEVSSSFLVQFIFSALIQGVRVKDAKGKIWLLKATRA